ncbi:RNA methyltransferase [Armatimonas sp.]|uniref:RNA methyltransferase n=1 Tax=Armatimonas sp. TaxID=1872638 RepID=UPI00375236C5
MTGTAFVAEPATFFSTAVPIGGEPNRTPLNNFHIVLIEPQESLNIGSVARAMQNLGFSHLHLVAPRGYDRERACVTARDASVILDAMTLHDSFPEAIDGMQEVVGLALRKGENPAHYVSLPQWSEKLPERVSRKTALVFGPEDDDLRNEHLSLCRWVVRIPTTAAYPSFNLAQSVLLTLYEITRALPCELSVAALSDAPTENAFMQFDRHLDGVMAASGFVRTGTPSPVPALVKALFRRLDPTRHELGVLLALFSRVHRNLTPPPPPGGG